MAAPSFELVPASAALPQVDVIICPSPESGPPDWAGLLGPAVGGELARAVARREFRGKPNELYFTSLDDASRTRVVAVGLGQPEAGGSDCWRRAAGTAALAARSRACSRMALLAGAAGVAALQAVVEGVVLAGFDVDTYRTQREATALDRVFLIVEDVTEEQRAAVATGQTLAAATNLARALANEPGNLLPPRELADRAAAIAAGAGLAVEVLDEDAIAALGMNLLLGVGQGSAEPPRFVVIRYQPDGVPPGPALGLIGKGITFDTGGISIKPADKMELMKFDMAGAAAVVGAMHAIAQLRPALPVVGLVAAAENMPGGRALRPGDVIRGASGQTVEINNTDAEGRLVLADAIWYAREKAGATHLVDVATLTGACVVALGHAASGLFGNTPAWSARVREVADGAGERVWPLPLFDDYREQLKSEIADLVNTGGRAAGACTAAKFLEAFTNGVAWVHLDVAGTAWLDEAKPYMPKGPTGVMTRTLASLTLAPAPLP